jgi:ribonuclease J
MSTHLKLTPMGGVGEIGSNMFIFEDDECGFIIDCGILFPSDNCFNINYLIPNFYGIKKDKIKDIIITHGHEDHIGAIAHLIEFHPDITVHCNGFAYELIKTKIKDFNHKVFKYTETMKIGNFEIDPIHVNHSIPDTFGLSISYNEYNFFYCSDFKVDFDSPYEKPFDFEKLKKLQQGKTTVGMIDSTNILSQRKTLSEKVVLEDIEKVFEDFKDNRLFITCFSSNVHRLKSFFDVAKKYKRNIILSGRSIHKYTEIAKKLGYVDNIRIYDEDFDNITKKNNLIIISGCQGDFFSSLRRLSSNEHSRIKLNENDKVVFSSKTIPGNEKSVNRIKNNITELGADVITNSEYPFIHASGHPGQEDLKILNKKINFDHYIPIHGESYFIKKHVEFIEDPYQDKLKYLLY